MVLLLARFRPMGAQAPAEDVPDARARDSVLRVEVERASCRRRPPEFAASELGAAGRWGQSPRGLATGSTRSSAAPRGAAWSGSPRRSLGAVAAWLSLSA